jgi:hypothetical protein
MRNLYPRSFLIHTSALLIFVKRIHNPAEDTLFLQLGQSHEHNNEIDLQHLINLIPDNKPDAEFEVYFYGNLLKYQGWA